MELKACVVGEILATPRGELLEICSVKYNRMRARVLYPIPDLPTYREYGADMVYLMDPPHPTLLAKYEEAKRKHRKK